MEKFWSLTSKLWNESYSNLLRKISNSPEAALFAISFSNKFVSSIQYLIITITKVGTINRNEYQSDISKKPSILIQGFKKQTNIFYYDLKMLHIEEDIYNVFFDL